MKLYHYVHCPFCVRVRMALGLLNQNYQSIVLPYNDEKTPVDLMGVKMLPIFEWQENDVSNESLDIIKRLDSENILSNDLLDQPIVKEVEDLLSEIGSNVHSLCMPYWMWTPEFDNESREYFQKKKEVKRGPFNKLVHRSDEFIDGLNKTLENLATKLTPYYQSDKLTVLDIMIASHLWGMYILPEYQFPQAIHSYLQKVKSETRFNYHEDFWK